MAASAEAAESGDSERMLDALDERARNGLSAVVKIRRTAREAIEADYPSAEKGPALTALGDAAQVATAAELFARRCDATCMAHFAETVGAPATEVVRGDEVEVTTVRGHTLRMHAGKDGVYGVVWNHPALAEEVTRSSRELAQIRENAKIFKKRSALANQ